MKPACGARAFLRKILRAASFSGRLGEAIPALRAATEDRRYVFLSPGSYPNVAESRELGHLNMTDNMVIIPTLEQLAEEFDASVPSYFPKKLSKDKAHYVREAIEKPKTTTDKPELQ